MKKTSLISCALFLLLAACHDDDESDVIAVRGEVSALLSGDGLPSDQREKAFEHDEMWLQVDAAGALSGFWSHPWDLEPRQHHYDLQLEFAPTDVAGTLPLLGARVCFTTCGDHPETDGCGGPCFDRLQSGTVDVREVSEDGRSFDLSFDFEVADAEGHKVKVSSGEARTND